MAAHPGQAQLAPLARGMHRARLGQTTVLQLFCMELPKLFENSLLGFEKSVHRQVQPIACSMKEAVSAGDKYHQSEDCALQQG